MSRMPSAPLRCTQRGARLHQTLFFLVHAHVLSSPSPPTSADRRRRAFQLLAQKIPSQPSFQPRASQAASSAIAVSGLSMESLAENQKSSRTSVVYFEREAPRKRPEFSRRVLQKSSPEEFSRRAEGELSNAYRVSGRLFQIETEGTHRPPPPSLNDAATIFQEAREPEPEPESPPPPPLESEPEFPKEVLCPPPQPISAPLEASSRPIPPRGLALTALSRDQPSQPTDLGSACWYTRARAWGWRGWGGAQGDHEKAAGPYVRQDKMGERYQMKWSEVLQEADADADEEAEAREREKEAEAAEKEAAELAADPERAAAAEAAKFHGPMVEPPSALVVRSDPLPPPKLSRTQRDELRMAMEMQVGVWAKNMGETARAAELFDASVNPAFPSLAACHLRWQPFLF